MRERSASVPTRTKPYSLDQNRNRLLETAQQITRGMSTPDNSGPPLNLSSPPDNQFFVKGSMAAMLHGANVTPGDLDLMTGNFPKASRTLQRMGYPPVGPMNPRIEHPPQGLPPIDVMHTQDWGAMNVPKETIEGVRVTSLARTLSDLRNDPRQDKQARNRRLRQEIVRKHTQESPI